MITLTNENLQDLIRNTYKNLGNGFKFATCDIYVFMDSFYIVPNIGTQVTANRDDFFNYLDLPSKYNHINELFTVDETLDVKSLEIHSYYNEDYDESSRTIYGEVRMSESYYRVEAASIQLNTIKICLPTDESGQILSYQGNINTVYNIEGSNPPKPLDLIPIKLDLAKTWIVEEYYLDRQNLIWDAEPQDEQITVESLVKLLDQSITSDSKKHSTNYKQTYIDSIIPPPKGLGSIAGFSFSQATIVSERSERVYVNIALNLPNFNFLPLSIETRENSGFINYTNTDTIYVSVKGSTILDDSEYAAGFVKETTRDSYNITLTANTDNTLSFRTIKNLLIPSMQIGEASLLTNDQNALNMLSTFGINDADTVVVSPIIKIEYVDYYVYTIAGQIYYGDEEDEVLHVL